MKQLLIEFAPIIIPALITLLMKSPFAKYIPPWITELIAKITPEQLQSLKAKVQAKTLKGVLREEAIEVVQSEVRQIAKVDLTDVQAGEFADFLAYGAKSLWDKIRGK